MLQEKLKNFKLILASQSPRRQMLLKGLDLNFETFVIPDVDESFPKELQSYEIATYLSEHKSKSYKSIIDKNTIVITADTIVWLKNKVLNKPLDKPHAFEMIKELSGNMHVVYTGVTLSSLNHNYTFYSETKVWFKQLTDTEINYYIDTYKPFDKAGAYGAQEWLGYSAIEKIEGSYFNVMGLPVHMIYSELDKFTDKLNNI